MDNHNNKLKLSVVIPVYNEESTLSQLISAVESVELPLEKEIILVDDCSTDGSREILNQLIHGFHITTLRVVNPQVRYKAVFLDKNTGKGAALRRGFKEATGDIVIIQDADLEYNPQDYPKLIQPIINKQVDIVYGSRFLKSDISSCNKIIYQHGYLFSRFLNWLSNILSGLWLSDMYTCYKVFSKDVIAKINPHLSSNKFGIDPELTAWVAKLNFKIVEVPISYTGRTYEEGKKINWKDGLAAIWHIIRFNLFTKCKK